MAMAKASITKRNCLHEHKIEPIQMPQELYFSKTSKNFKKVGLEEIEKYEKCHNSYQILNLNTFTEKVVNNS